MKYLILTILLTACTPVAAREYSATMIRVIDGDTMVANIDLGFGIHYTQTIRLAEIDTPETHRPKSAGEKAHGLEAKAFVKSLLPVGGAVRITVVKDGGKYGRIIAFIDNGTVDVTGALRAGGFEKRASY